MDHVQQLTRIAERLRHDTLDSRHTLLDVSEDFLAVADALQVFPDSVRDEVRTLREELKKLQPQFPSHRSTSVLFDREGLGQQGRQRASELCLRIIAVCDAAVRMQRREQ